MTTLLIWRFVNSVLDSNWNFINAWQKIIEKLDIYTQIYWDVSTKNFNGTILNFFWEDNFSHDYANLQIVHAAYK